MGSAVKFGSDTKKMVLRYGACTEFAANGKTTKATVRCTACGKIIKSDDDLSEVHFSVTKRKTCLFWHDKCTDTVWSNTIKDNKQK